MLLFGPSGCGKTFATKYLLRELLGQSVNIIPVQGYYYNAITTILTNTVLTDLACSLNMLETQNFLFALCSPLHGNFRLQYLSLMNWMPLVLKEAKKIQVEYTNEHLALC